MADPTTQTAIMSRQGSRERLMIVGDDEDDDGVGCMAQCVEDSCVDRWALMHQVSKLYHSADPASLHLCQLMLPS